MLVQNLKVQNAENQFKKFKYQQKKSLKIKFFYNFFALDTNCAILFAGNQDKCLIKAFALYNQPKLIKTLINSQQYISILIYMEKSRNLAYVNKYNKIVICELKKTFQFTTCQEFQANSERIITLSTNESQDLLISGSFDEKIKFWKKDNFSWRHLYTIDAEMSARNFSLNAQETKLIALVGGVIKIFELQPNFQWAINQTIPSNGDYICFINDNQFIVQSQQQGKSLGIYNYDEQKKLYIISKYFHLSYLGGISFPPQFIKKKNILIFKPPQCIVFFGIDQEGNYIRQQTNTFNTLADGKITNNGRFLVTMLSYCKQFYFSTYQSLE